MVRNSDPDEAGPQGIPLEPPDVAAEVDWEEVKRELNNQLVQSGLFDWKDVQRKQNAITSILMHIIRRQVVRLFKLKAKGAP